MEYPSQRWVAEDKDGAGDIWINLVVVRLFSKFQMSLPIKIRNFNLLFRVSFPTLGGEHRCRIVIAALRPTLSLPLISALYLPHAFCHPHPHRVHHR